MSFCTDLLNWQKEAGLTQKEAALLFGVSVPTYRKYTKLNTPPWIWFRKQLDALKSMSLDEVLSELERKKKIERENAMRGF
jgi:transcriptional regulator with XRE-family HTH domain